MALIYNDNSVMWVKVKLGRDRDLWVWCIHGIDDEGLVNDTRSFQVKSSRFLPSRPLVWLNLKKLEPKKCGEMTQLAIVPMSSGWVEG